MSPLKVSMKYNLNKYFVSSPPCGEGDHPKDGGGGSSATRSAAFAASDSPSSSARSDCSGFNTTPRPILT